MPVLSTSCFPRAVRVTKQQALITRSQQQSFEQARQPADADLQESFDSEHFREAIVHFSRACS